MTEHVPQELLEIIAVHGVARCISDLRVQHVDSSAHKRRIKAECRAWTRGLCAMEGASQAMRSFLHPVAGETGRRLWTDVLEAYCEVTSSQKDPQHGQLLARVREEGKEDKNKKLCPKRALFLLTHSGCEFCGDHELMRKVTVEFSVRACTACLHQRTICDYKLRMEYRASPRQMDDLQRALPCKRVGMYKRHLGTYQLCFFWTQDVLDYLGVEDLCAAAEVFDLSNAAHEEEQQRIQVIKSMHLAQLFNETLADKFPEEPPAWLTMTRAADADDLEGAARALRTASAVFRKSSSSSSSSTDAAGLTVDFRAWAEGVLTYSRFEAIIRELLYARISADFAYWSRSSSRSSSTENENQKKTKIKAFKTYTERRKRELLLLNSDLELVNLMTFHYDRTALKARVLEELRLLDVAST